jgi:hypothetical protein
MLKHYQRDSAVIIVSGLVAIIYNSWPLGYILNNPVAHHQLASELEAAGQPYNWFFVCCDLITCLLLLYLALRYWQRRPATYKNGALNAVIFGLALFGVFTAVSALTPLSCQINDLRCGAHASQILALHNLTGGVASFGLFISLSGTWLFSIERPLTPATVFIRLVTTLWCLSGIAYLFFTVINQYMQLVQDVFLILSGIGVIAICLPYYKLITSDQTDNIQGAKISTQ